MLRRNPQLSVQEAFPSLCQKPNNHSPSTQDSCSPRHHPETNTEKSSIRKEKEKSQLCKKYLQFGECPYQKRCKFAHGLHQLRKNQQVNSKYKTKECGVFLSEGVCTFGERCNFIHEKCHCGDRKALFDAGFQEVRAEGRVQSRLLSLLA